MKRAIKVERDECLLVCDWCDKEQTYSEWPKMDTIRYVEEYEGNHGRMRNRDEEFHICSYGRCKQELYEMMRERKLKRLGKKQGNEETT